MSIIKILLIYCDLSHALVDVDERQREVIQKAKLSGFREKTRYGVILNGKWVKSRFVANFRN